MEDQMKCAECGGRMTVERNTVRRYDVGGLPHVELHGVDTERCTKCGKEEVIIPRIAQLHQVLADVLVKQPRMLAPVEIRFLRKHMGHSTAAFAERMGVSRETVSRWETAGSPMGAPSDRLLRLIVLNHEPTKSYAVDDLLKSLNDTPVPKKLSAVAMCNGVKGWTTSAGRKLAKV
jgi:putative transcriptional regulator